MENNQKDDTSKKVEDHILDVLKHPLTTFGGGLLSGYLLGTYVGNQKVKQVEEQFSQQLAKRDEQLDKLIEQVALSSRRQDQFIKAFAAYSGQEIEELEKDPEDNVYKNRSKFGKRKFAKI